MDFLKNNRLFDFLYGGKPVSELTYDVVQTETENGLTSVYTFADGLKLTNIAIKRSECYEWVNWLENTSDKPTEIISDLYDACVALPMEHVEPRVWQSYHPLLEDVTTIYAPAGSTWIYSDFYAPADTYDGNTYNGHIFPGAKKEYSTSGGRSSEKNAPFFNVHMHGKGYIFAIGWTGQWKCLLERTNDAIVVKTKVEDTHFRLLPGEKIRTTSFVVMPYEGTVLQSQNQWRRLVKKEYSQIGQPGRDAVGPLCASIWGGMKTSSILERLDTMRKNDLKFDYIWMDAGWYGIDTKATPDEFEGDWPLHTGDWCVSPIIHPNGLKDVVAAIREAGMKFLLWFEPERVIRTTPIALAHPEYFISPENENEQSLLLNLGLDEAWEYCFNTLAGIIEDLNIDCYRQDFNMAPLSYWRKNDAEDRKGITEIKHIMGMYRLWDALLEKFPNLLIDNCASGGRRIDIETLRRSIPLWRSDYECPANYLTEGSQCHNLTFNTWMPFSGTGTGRPYDTYRIRSAYSPALNVSYAYSERNTFGDDPEKIVWLKERIAEYLKVRPYMSEDFYPLTSVSDRSDVWCASQFDRPEQKDGIILVFRRENAPYENAMLSLYAIDKDLTYVFTDADTGSEQTFSGADLIEKGFPVEMKERYSSRIYFYQAK